jgi:uncharacterized membrane protein
MILLKSIMYRVWQSVITFLIALTVTHKFETAAQIVGLEVLFKIFTYWVFEKLWRKAVKEPTACQRQQSDVD